MQNSLPLPAIVMLSDIGPSPISPSPETDIASITPPDAVAYGIRAIETRNATRMARRMMYAHGKGVMTFTHPLGWDAAFIQGG